MYIVAYDIADDRERNLLVRQLNNFGERVQKSVWLCDMDWNRCRKLQAAVAKLDLQSGYVDIWQAQVNSVRIGKSGTEPKYRWITVV